MTFYVLTLAIQIWKTYKYAHNTFFSDLSFTDSKDFYKNIIWDFL